MNQVAVQQKVSCLFETKVISEVSTKRPQQPFKVVASNRLKLSASKSHIESSVCTEKVDGTCTYVGLHDDRPWLWARLDRKPTKSVEKKFKKHQQQIKIWEQNPDGSRPSDFLWNAAKDFKEASEGWIPAHGVEIVDGVPQPDEHGHMPGWLPLSLSSRQHCWHLDTVHLQAGLCLLMEQSDQQLHICVASLEDLKERTLELIGTNVNGNPYKMGSKNLPLHVLVGHGSITFSQSPLPEYNDLRKWLTEADEGAVEGLVWHCANGHLFKVHRHHLQLPWPLQAPRLTRMPVHIKVDISQFAGVEFEEKLLFAKLGRLNGQVFDSLCDVLQ